MSTLVETVASQMEIGAEFSDGYVGLGTGMVCRLHEFDESSDLRRLAESGRLRMIPAITSQDLYLWMVDFSRTVQDPAVRREIEAALAGISAVWKFRNALYHRPDLSDRWENFKRKKLLDLAVTWLSSEAK